MGDLLQEKPGKPDFVSLAPSLLLSSESVYDATALLRLHTVQSQGSSYVYWLYDQY